MLAVLGIALESVHALGTECAFTAVLVVQGGQAVAAGFIVGSDDSSAMGTAQAFHGQWLLVADVEQVIAKAANAATRGEVADVELPVASGAGD